MYLRERRGVQKKRKVRRDRERGDPCDREISRKEKIVTDTEAGGTEKRWESTECLGLVSIFFFFWWGQIATGSMVFGRLRPEEGFGGAV